jgi:hypothetical protein
VTGDEVFIPETVNLVTVVEDSDGNLLTSSSHVVSDIGLGVIRPTWAATTSFAGSSVTITSFDGSKALPLGNDITLSSTILAPSQQFAATFLYYDVAVPSSVTNSGFWLPSPSIPILVPSSNAEARQRGEASAVNFVRDYIIPVADPEVDSGAEVEFLLKVGSLYCAQTASPTDPRTVIPWKFKILDTTQRGGVTILNNVINPLHGDTTQLVYTVSKPGLVTVQLFTLSGDIVEVLQRGQQNAGTYRVSWGGKNGGGRAVARGIYFIRIVGPGIDETRKILVVK